MKATLRNYRQSPRKVALAAGLVRGKTATQALTYLKFATKKASSPVIKLIESALSNARNAGNPNPETLIIKEIRVDHGVTLKRMMPRARGSGARINKRSSHIMLVLGEATAKKGSKKGTSVHAGHTDAVVKSVTAPKKTKTVKSNKTNK